MILGAVVVVMAMGGDSPETAGDGMVTSSVPDVPDDGAPEFDIPYGSAYTVSTAFEGTLSLGKGRYPKHRCSSVMSMASKSGLGSVIFIPNDDAATVAAELRFAIEPCHQSSMSAGLS